MNKVNCFVGILFALVFCSSCSAKSPEITGNPDPPNITSEERSLHQILQIDEDTSYDSIYAHTEETVYKADSELITCIITNQNAGKGFYYYEIPCIEQKVNDEWVRLFNNAERLEVAQWLFCGIENNTTEFNSCSVNIRLSDVKPKTKAGEYRFVVFTADKPLYAEFKIIE